MSIKIALAGNPNCGKTTLFNALTGSNQFVGNWPGVTVEKKEGKLKGHKDVTIMDLPGIYSLSPYTLEEVVARNYLINEMPDAIINIVDGTNLERNLYLSTQIMELGIPVVMAINMMDLVQKSGNKIHIDKLSKKLGCEVVEISALKGTGIMKAAEKAISAAQSKKKTIPVHEFAQDVEDAIKSVENKLTGTVAEAQKRFFAIKLIEKDDKIVEQMKSVPDVSYEVKALEDKFDDDTESIITNERYVYISSIIGQCYTKSSTGKKLTTSDKIDRIVTNRWLALPIFAVVMWVVYYVSVTTVGTIVTDWTNDVLFGEIIPPAVESALEAVRSGKNPELTTREKHTRECFVVAEEGADLARIENEIKTMPNYFDEYDTTVHFISEEELKRDHSGIPHGGFVIRTGKTGWNDENSHVIEYSLKLDSNPEFTSSVIIAYARAAYRMNQEGQNGCKTVFDVAPAYLSALSGEELRKHLL